MVQARDKKKGERVEKYLFVTVTTICKFEANQLHELTKRNATTCRGVYSKKSDCLVGPSFTPWFYPKTSHFTENRQKPS